MKNLFARFVREDEGQDLIEYVLLAGFISLVAFVAIQTLGQTISGDYNAVNSTLEAAPFGSGS